MGSVNAAAPDLLAACLAAPDDDAPRFAWANAVGGPRGELVAVQCALARGELPRDIAVNRRRRETELLREHGDTWAGLGDLGYVFRRGFVESLRVDAADFASRGEELLRAAPLLTRLQLDGLDDAPDEEIVRRLDGVLDSPWFSRIQRLRMVEVGRWVETESDFHPRDYQSAGSVVLRRLVEKGGLRNLRGLELPRCGLSGSELRVLTASPDARGLLALDLRHQDVDRYTGLDSADAAKLVEAPNLANLEELDLSDALGHGPMLAGQTREQRAQSARDYAERDALLLRHPRILGLRKLAIANCGFSDSTIDTLATTSYARLRLLDLSGNQVFEDDFVRLGAAPGLATVRELVFDGPCKYVFNEKMATALAEAPRFDALRILRLRNNYVSPEAATILLRSPLAKRLEVIDLGRNTDVVKRAAEWRAMFDGVLVLGDE
jgi:hypothetical protein